MQFTCNYVKIKCSKYELKYSTYLNFTVGETPNHEFPCQDGYNDTSCSPNGLQTMKCHIAPMKCPTVNLEPAHTSYVRISVK